MGELIFFTSILLILYTYFGYPLLLYVISLVAKKGIRQKQIIPNVSVIIPVHNEAHQIRKKLNNCLAFDYPKDKVDIIVVSDHSTDNTEEIISGMASEQINFMQLPFRGGKVAAQNFALEETESEIIIFTDVAILTSTDCIKIIVQNFNDPEIGVVSCRDAVIERENDKKGEGGYIRYDMLVRKLTSRIGSIIGVTGGFYAVRREIAKGGWNPVFPPDFYVALRSIKRGLRVVEDDRVKAYYRTAAKEWDELPRKVRTINRGINALLSYSNRNLLNPFKYGFVSIELISHKLLRWLTPFLIMSFFLSNLVLVNDSIFFAFLFFLQLLFFLLCGVVFLNRKIAKNNFLFKFLLYFTIANIAIFKAWYEFIFGKKYAIWKPTKRNI